MAAGPYRRRFDLDAWRARFKKTLAARFVLRFHMALILLLVIAAGLVTTRGLRALGVDSMAVRYACSACAGYGAFFVLVRLWLGYLTDAIAREAPEVRADDAELASSVEPEDRVIPAAGDPDVGVVLVGPSGRRQRRAATSGGSSSSSVDLSGLDVDIGAPSGSSGGGGGGGFSLDIGDGAAEIIIVIVVGLIALAVFGAAGYFIWEAPVILGEAAVEVVLASALVRASRRIDRPGWSGSVLKATWIPAAIVFVMATGGGAVAQGLCPKEKTLPGVIQRCVLSDDPADSSGAP